jgi:hypothetical protein
MEVEQLEKEELEVRLHTQSHVKSQRNGRWMRRYCKRQIVLLWMGWGEQLKVAARHGERTTEY